jgi:hypothetical protein
MISSTRWALISSTLQTMWCPLQSKSHRTNRSLRNPSGFSQSARHTQVSTFVGQWGSYYSGDEMNATRLRWLKHQKYRANSIEIADRTDRNRFTIARQSKKMDRRWSWPMREDELLPVSRVPHQFGSSPIVLKKSARHRCSVLADRRTIRSFRQVPREPLKGKDIFVMVTVSSHLTT